MTQQEQSANEISFEKGLESLGESFEALLPEFEANEVSFTNQTDFTNYVSKFIEKVFEGANIPFVEYETNSDIFWNHTVGDTFYLLSEENQIAQSSEPNAKGKITWDVDALFTGIVEFYNQYKKSPGLL